MDSLPPNGYHQKSAVTSKAGGVNKAYAEQVASQVNGANAVISKAETKPGKESAPSPSI